MNPCLACSGLVSPVMSFGRMPIANGFLAREQFGSEPFYELAVGFCPACRMVQLLNLVPREKMFHEQYAFFSSTSTRMAEHFRRLAVDVMARLGAVPDPFVVEIGSNDGILLQHFARGGVRHLGVEPSANVAQVARDRGVSTVSAFFDEDLARQIVAQQGQADVFLGANVMCHIPHLQAVISGIDQLLKPDGLVMFEDPYLGDIVEKTSYDQIYDEHALYFSLNSISFLFGRYGFEVVDVTPLDVHGGSMRYTLARRGRRPAANAVAAQTEHERSLGLGRLETYAQFRRNTEQSRDQLVSLLRRLRGEGKRVVGYAATSKSTTVTNYCGITPDLIEFISDTTPVKQGKFSPGTHIPVRPHAEFAASYPDYALLFGWNHAQEIMAKEQAFRAAGGKWIVYVPTVKIVE